MAGAKNPFEPVYPSFAEAFRFWLKLGFISFGGPTGQIAIMHRELVEQKRWISEARFLHALNFCMLLPGPEAQQLAIYIGWLLHRTRGGLVAGVLFVLPSAFILWGLSLIYLEWGHVAWLAALFDGLKPAVLAIVLAAVLRIGKKALKNEILWSIAGLAFVAIFFGGVPFPVIVVGAGVIGLLGNRWLPSRFSILQSHGNSGSVIDDDSAARSTPTLAAMLRAFFIGVAVWWTPILGLGALLGWQHTLFREGVFFAKAAMVTFGGAYAVLPYVSQQAVEHFHWLAPGQMLDGLALAETTPGPLIMVLQFVGFTGAWHQPAPFAPLLAATLGAAITTWATFVPCFIWIFLGAPYIERLRENARISAALSAITAAVVGVILNLAIWFGWHVLFPENSPVNIWGLAVFGLSFIALHRWKWDILPVVAAAATLGVVRWALGL